MRIIWLAVILLVSGMFALEYGTDMAQWAGIMWVQG